MAGKQSDDMLYFYYDVDSLQLYSKAIASSAAQLRLQNVAEKSPQNQDLIVVPNPINEDLFVTLPEQNTNYRLQLFDINGKQMINTFGKTADLQSALRRSIHQLSSGVYLLKVNGGSFNKTQLINKL